MATSSAAAAEFTHRLAPGNYSIEVIVEDPGSGEKKTVRQVEKCFRPAAIANHAVFEMLSSSQASACPKYEICAGEFRTGFIAQCLDDHPMLAVGMFALETNNFRGRIEVKDRSDRVVHIEIQYGARVGDCPNTAERTSGVPGQ